MADAAGRAALARGSRAECSPDKRREAQGFSRGEGVDGGPTSAGFESAAQDAHHVSLDAATPDDEEKGPPSGSEVNSTPDSEVEVVGVSIPDVPTQASVGGAVKVESSAVDEPSGTSRPAQDVIVLDDNSDESPSQARTIKGEGPLPAVQEEPASSLPNETPLPSSPVPNAAPDAPPRVATSEDPQMVIDLIGPGEDSGEQASAARMKEFVADQPDTRLSTMATSRYVAARLTMMHPSDNWISDWSLVRLSPCTAADATAAMIPMTTLSLRECAALLQTLFFEAGFRVTAGVPTRVMPALNVHALGDAALDAVKEEHPDDDVPMSTREMDVLGRECLFRMRVAEVRPTRSPASSAVGRPESKRPQYGPPRPSSIPSMSSHLSYRSSIPASQDADALSTRMSVFQSAVSRRSSGRESSLSGTTAADSEESNPNATSGGSAPIQGGWGVQVTETVLPTPPVPVNQDDVDMSESGHTSIRSGHRSRTYRRHTRSRRSSPSSSSSESSSEDERRRGRRGSKHPRCPKRSPKSKRSPSRSVKSGWSVHSSASRISEIALTMMRVTQDAMARVDASVQEMKQQLQDKDNAPDREPEAADEGKRIFQTYQATQLLVGREDALENQCALDTQAPVQVIMSEATAVKAREVVGAIQEDALKRARETVKAERAQEEHLRSEAEAAKLQVQEARMQKTVEEQRRLLEEQQKLFDRRIALLEAAQSRDKAAGPDQGNVRRTRSRDTRTTSSQVQGAQATPAPDPTVQWRHHWTHGDLPAAQLQATLAPMTGVKYEREESTPRVVPSKATQATIEKSGPKPAASSRSETKKTAARKDSLKKRSNKRGDPSDDSSSSDSSEEDSSDEDSDSSSGEVPTNVATATTQGGTTMNWRGQLSRHDRQDWTRLSKAFRREYCKSKALAFLYRLNIAAEHAKVDFRKSSKQREMHIRQFIRILHDEPTKAAVESHRFKKVADLEYILKCREELHHGDDPPARTTQARDFRADNVPRDRFRSKHRDRALVVTAESDSEPDSPDGTEEAVERRGPVAETPAIQEVHDVSAPRRCEDWRVFQEVKKLVREEGLTDLPSHVREDILNGEASSEGKQLNH
ncbi:hypothetical protein PHYSODRAFT_263128 [Phytophthora sojae]|uniref:Uncharacterized protein n=1 Tax=Phytophthora sojae (strain P6497) TaxID=1094619 RepID=G4ZLD9_PHYSP|nr:hypothetical protein PHYSODRAFT_263128 [Phytophthora sojae]EGZ15985.1 hypothetical protein PHYSODRAFT_263128 [Phytophthora sojae]|eukprot:XP_009529734.1 hypothetical protein PHYSODRAFT_263128 [Phytophthora sojae]